MVFRREISVVKETSTNKRIVFRDVCVKADLDLKVALIIIRWFSAGKSVLSRRPPQTRESFSLGEDASAAVKSTLSRIDTSQTTP